jgi:hypothetical protein
MHKIVIITMIVTTTAMANTNQTTLYKTMQQQALAAANTAIVHGKPEEALSWVSTVTQLQASEMTECMLQAKRAVIPNPEIAFPVLKMLGMGLLSAELAKDGEQGGHIMNLIEVVVDKDVTMQAARSTVQGILQYMLQSQQAIAEYQSRATALSKAMSDKYANKGAFGMPGALNSVDRAKVEALKLEGTTKGYPIPYPLEALLTR